MKIYIYVFILFYMNNLTQIYEYKITEKYLYSQNKYL